MTEERIYACSFDDIDRTILTVARNIESGFTIANFTRDPIQRIIDGQSEPIFYIHLKREDNK